MSNKLTWTTSTNSDNSNTWTTGTVSNVLSSSNASTSASTGLNIAGGSVSLGYNSTPCISWGGQDYTSGYLTVQDNLGSLITYLKEPEIENLLDTLIERAVDDQNTLKQIISSIIRSRHFSEEFILKYFDYVEIHDIRCHHASDINSHNYERLALLLVASRD